MNEQQHKTRKKASNDDNGKFDNFFAREMKERIEIKRQTMAFKAMVDAEKEQELHKIENDSKLREADSVSLESALHDDDAEQIREALKKMQI